MGGQRWRHPLCAALLLLVAGAGLVSSDLSDAVQDISDIGIDTPPSSSKVEVKDALDDIVIEGAISLSRVRRASSLAGGTPGEDFPVFSSIPKTNFNCADKGLGYYADVDTGCQVFHVCHADGRMNSFLCPNTTVFNQRRLVCDWWYNVDCGVSSQHFSVNEEIGKVTSSPTRTSVAGNFGRGTTVQTPAAPSPLVRGSGFTTITQNNFQGTTVSQPTRPTFSPSPSFSSPPRSSPSSPPPPPSPSPPSRTSSGGSQLPTTFRPNSFARTPARVSVTRRPVLPTLSPARPISRAPADGVSLLLSGIQSSQTPSNVADARQPGQGVPLPTLSGGRDSTNRGTQTFTNTRANQGFQTIPPTRAPQGGSRRVSGVSIGQPAGTRAPTPSRGTGTFGNRVTQSPSSFQSGGVPLPTLSGRGSPPSSPTRLQSGGVPLPTPSRGSSSISPTSLRSGGVPLPTPSGGRSPSSPTSFQSGGIPLPTPSRGSSSNSPTSFRSGGVPLPTLSGGRSPSSPTSFQSGGVPLPTLSGRGSSGTSSSQGSGARTQPQRQQSGQPQRIPGAVSTSPQRGASFGVPLPGFSSTGGSSGGRRDQGRGSGIVSSQAAGGSGGVPLPILSSSGGGQRGTVGVSLPSPRPSQGGASGGSVGIRLPVTPSSRGSGFGSSRPTTVQGKRGPILIIEADRDDLDDRFDDDRFDLDDRFDDDRFDLDDRFDDDRFDDDRFDLDDRFDDDRFDLDDRFDDDRFDFDDRFDDDRFDDDRFDDDRFDDDRFDLDDRFDDLDDRFDDLDDRFDDDRFRTVTLPRGSNIPTGRVVVFQPPSEVQLPPPPPPAGF